MSTDVTGRTSAVHRLKARRSGIDTGDEPVAYMQVDCALCRAEGLRGHSRIRVSSGEAEVIATAHHVADTLVGADEVALSEAAWRRLSPEPGELLSISHPPALVSFGAVRGKMYGKHLDAPAMRRIVADLVSGRYSDVHTAAFVTACATRPLDVDEVEALTRAMIDTGDRLDWDWPVVADKHCVGGLPGNRTTPIVVAIVAAQGIRIPKTSSRAITSPAGTADVMETLTPVTLDLERMRRVVEREGGCLAWGGAVRLSPADDILIRVERALDIDSMGQLVASVLSKKIAAGSTHVLLDLPVGPTAKLRDPEAADAHARMLETIAGRFGLRVRVLVTDGRQPVGRGLGPALEARDVLAVLQGAPDAPNDLRERAVALAGALLEFAGGAGIGRGVPVADAILADGRAWAKFQRICEAQGGMRTPPVAPARREIVAMRSGLVRSIDNRRLARVAKLAGAPDVPAAGLELRVRLRQQIMAGQPLFEIHAETEAAIQYVLNYLEATGEIIAIETDQ